MGDHSSWKGFSSVCKRYLKSNLSDSKIYRWNAGSFGNLITDTLKNVTEQTALEICSFIECN